MLGLNLYANLGGYGGYQVLTRQFISTTMKDPNLDLKIITKNLPNNEDSYILDKIAKDVNKDFYEHSLAIYSPREALSFWGKQRAIYPMHEGTKLDSHTVSLLNTCDQVWYSCSFLADTFESSGVNPEKLKSFPGAVDTKIFKPGRNNKVRNRFGNGSGITEEDPLVFLLVGKYERRKSSFETVEAFLKAFENNSLRKKVMLKVKWSTGVYSRPMEMIKAELKGLFTQYPKAASRVKLIDNNNINVVEMYNNADCLLFPSKAEGIGLPLLESMACGLPSITTKYSSLSNFARDDSSIILPDQGMAPMKDEFYNIHPETWGEWGVVKSDDIKQAMLDYVEMSSKERFNMSLAARKNSLDFDISNNTELIHQNLGG